MLTSRNEIRNDVDTHRTEDDVMELAKKCVGITFDDPLRLKYVDIAKRQLKQIVKDDLSGILDQKVLEWNGISRDMQGLCFHIFCSVRFL